jgi:Bacteriophage tail sheath protein
MATYLHPGVYIEEVERGPKPIEGVPTSTAAFLGEAERGPIKPRMVTSYKDYRNWFGDVFGSSKFLPYAINGFFENGGQNVYICRLVGENATPAEAAFGSNFSIRAAGPGTWGNRVWVTVLASTTKAPDSTGALQPVGFRVRTAYWAPQDTAFTLFDPFAKGNEKNTPQPTYVEDFDDLVTDESSPDFYGKRLPFIDLDKGQTNQGPDSSGLVTLVRAQGAPANVAPDMGSIALSNGKDDPNALTSADLLGLPSQTGTRKEAQGLAALELDPYRDVALVYAPGMTDQTFVSPIIDHCENMRFRFAAIDCPKTDTAPDPRDALKTDSSYAAYYYPWIYISDPKTGARKLVPPGGHALGVYARTDSERGVFKAPANEIVRGALDLQVDIGDNDQNELNPKGVNAIRQFPGRGIRIWGARTITSDALWKYISVRRLFIFLERSIYEGTQWVVFEPNDPQLWARVTDTIRIFLRAQWRLGALFGRTEDQAFFITCDERVMSQDDILNGRLICEIGIAPVRPAEFVIFRIFQNTAEAQQ